MENAKLLSESPLFEKPAKATIKQMSTKELLSKHLFYKQPIKKINKKLKKLRLRKLSNHELLREIPFYGDINVSRKENAFKKYAEAYEV